MLDCVALALDGEPGVDWLNQRGGQSSQVPTWPASRRMAVVAVVETAEEALDFWYLSTPAALDQVVEEAQGRRVLFFPIPFAKLLELCPVLPKPEGESAPDVSS